MSRQFFVYNFYPDYFSETYLEINCKDKAGCGLFMNVDNFKIFRRPVYKYRLTDKLIPTYSWKERTLWAIVSLFKVCHTKLIGYSGRLKHEERGY